jgi:hypothetical protein
MSFHPCLACGDYHAAPFAGPGGWQCCPPCEACVEAGSCRLAATGANPDRVLRYLVWKLGREGLFIDPEESAG